MTGFNLSRHLANAALDDTETRLIIPSKQAFITGVASGIIAEMNDDLLGSPVGNSGASLIENLLNTTLLNLGVTGIEIDGEMVAPRSKGIGSIGEILHLLGSRLEEIKLEFTTDLFPGVSANLLKRLIQSTLDHADLVYVIDDLVSVAPCVLLKYKLRKVGRIKTAIMGELKLTVLRVKEFSGLRGAISTTLLSLTSTSVSNLITDLPQEFKWIGRFAEQKVGS